MSYVLIIFLSSNLNILQSPRCEPISSCAQQHSTDVKQALFVLLEGSIQPIRSFQSSSSSWILCNLLETVRYHYPSLHLQRNIRLADLRRCWPLLISQPLRIGQGETSLQDKESSTQPPPPTICKKRGKIKCKQRHKLFGIGGSHPKLITRVQEPEPAGASSIAVAWREWRK